MSMAPGSGIGLGWIIAPVVSGVVAGTIGIVGVTGLVSSQTATPPVVDAPYVVYGSNS